jgi:hypothetical protein
MTHGGVQRRMDLKLRQSGEASGPVSLGTKREAITDTWREAWERSEQKHRELQDRILAIPGSQRVLSKLTEERADRGHILSLLASAVTDKDFWRKEMRRKKRELESIADQLETVANHAQRISLDPLCYGSLWLPLLGIGEWDMVKPPQQRAPIWIFEFMRLYGKNCRERAKAFGSLLREHPPRQKRMMIDCLLLRAWLLTGKYHDKEIAFLLTNAFEAVGSKREFTEDQIKKHRQRYVVPRIQAYLLAHPAVQFPIRQKGDTLPPQDSFPHVP